MARRKYKAEGSFADAANNHGFKRSRFRGIEKVRIQNLLVAATQNLRKLMRHISRNPALQYCKAFAFISEIFSHIDFFSHNVSEY